MVIPATDRAFALALVVVLSLTVVGCRPSPAPSSPALSPGITSVACGALSKRNCEGYVETARVTLDIKGSARAVADASCPVVGSCERPVDAWVAFIGEDDRVIGVVVLRGDPSGPPSVERWNGPVPPLPKPTAD